RTGRLPALKTFCLNQECRLRHFVLSVKSAFAERAASAYPELESHKQGRPLEFGLQAVCSLRAPSKPRDARPAKAGTPAVTRRSTKARAPTNRQSPYAGRARADRRSRARKNRAIPAARAAPAGAATAGVDSTEDRAPAGDDEVGRLGFAQKRCLELCV